MAPDPSNPHQDTPANWARMLRSIARRSLEDAGLPPDHDPDPAAFADDMGHRRPLDAHFFAWRRSRVRGTPPTPQPPPAPDDGPDAALWHALTDPAADPHAALDAFDTGSSRDRTDSGALFGQHAGRVPLEVWTERELAAAHALGWLARDRADGSLQQRVDAAMAWHLDNLQPDNATNHPFAVHLFLVHAAHREHHAGRMYAETLLHNCQVSMGRADTLSAHILLDAADWLDTHAPAP